MSDSWRACHACGREVEMAPGQALGDALSGWVIVSRLRDKAIGQGKTREDHAGVANQLFAAYARGREVRELAVILGEAALSELDKIYLKFAGEFEDRFIRQGEAEKRSIEETLKLSWQLIKLLPREELKRIKDEIIEKYADQG